MHTCRQLRRVNHLTSENRCCEDYLIIAQFTTPIPLLTARNLLLTYLPANRTVSIYKLHQTCSNMSFEQLPKSTKTELCQTQRIH